jgi:hypothetical protein
MRRFVVVLSVLAIVVLAASSAQAGFVFGDYYFQLTNWDNGGGGYGIGPSFNLPTGPTATTDGGIWVKTGSSYALSVNDVNIEVDFRTAPDQPTNVITNTCLLSNGVASGDSSGGIYPGYWFVGNADPGSPYNMSANQYYVPTATTFADPTNFQFDLYMWYGTETSYAAAAAAGEKVAHSGWFAAGPMAVGLGFPTWSTFKYMPSMVLAVQTPEPSTIVLVTTGLMGLLAYAWRKRK